MANSVFIQPGISSTSGSGFTLLVPLLLPDGTAAASSLSFASQTGTGFNRDSSGYIGVNFSGNNYFQFATSGLLLNSNGGVRIVDDAANTLAQRNGTNAQTFRVYNTYTSGSVNEYLGLFWSSNVAFIRPESNGATDRALTIGTVGAVPLTFRTSNIDRWAIDSAGTLSAVGYSSGARSTIGSVSQVTTAVTLSGATSGTGNVIPAGSEVVGVATTTTTTITGASGYTVGDGTDADRYGDITGTAVGTATGSTAYTADPRWWANTARAITLTAKTSNFTGGVTQVTVFYRTATGA